MEENMNDEVIEKINEADAEEIPPTQEDYTSQYQSEDAGYTTTDDSEHVAKILGIVSLVTGILSLLCCCITGLNIVFGIAAIVTGIISVKKGESARGLAIAGIICGGLGTVISICMIAFAGFISAIDGVKDSFDKFL